jgi:hypothetical protein
LGAEDDERIAPDCSVLATEEGFEFLEWDAARKPRIATAEAAARTNIPTIRQCINLDISMPRNPNALTIKRGARNPLKRWLASYALIHSPPKVLSI